MTTQHAWTLRIRDLHCGDALVLPEYRVCHCMTTSWRSCYVVWADGLVLLKVIVYQPRQAWERVAAWLAADGQDAACAMYRCDDPVALLPPPPSMRVIHEPARDVPVIAFEPARVQLDMWGRVA